MSDESQFEREASRAPLFIPLAVFLLIAAFGYWGFKLNDPHQLPSALLGKPFPDFSAVRLEDLHRASTGKVPFVGREVLIGSPVLVNVWATWCPTCLAELDELSRIRREHGLKIVGVNYKDQPDKARLWLKRHGNPYEFNLFDGDGAIGVNLGVYGAPETFLLDSAGTIVYKRVGDVNRRIWEEEIRPALERMVGS